jgi:DNA polymerase-1
MSRSKKVWLLLDVNYLSYRAYHAMKGLEYEHVKTGVMFGFLRDLQTLERKFNSNRFVFCFDHGKPKRLDIYPGYKQARRDRAEADPELTQQLEEVRATTTTLRRQILPNLGYENIYAYDGFEADDVIGAFCKMMDPLDEAVVVSGDEDMYQLLADGHVGVWHPSKEQMVTASSFISSKGVLPVRWKSVKALAGCSSDNIPGCKGIGEATACLFYSNQLKPGSVKIEKIRAFFKSEEFKLFKRLVTIPFEGFPLHDFKRSIVDGPTKLDKMAFRKLCDRYGMKSLLPQRKNAKQSIFE